jgi:hypothetical protein
MNKVFVLCVLLICFRGLFAQQLIINEISQGTGSSEYVEFVVIGTPTCVTPVPSLDLRKVIIDDNNGYFAPGSGTGIAGGAVRFAAAQIINLCGAGGLEKFPNEVRDVRAVDVVPDLFALVSEDGVRALLQVTADQIAEKAVELDSGVVRAGEAAAAKAAGGHAEIASVFLHHDVRCEL